MKFCVVKFLLVYFFICTNSSFAQEENTHWKDPNPKLTNEINEIIENKLKSIENQCIDAKFNTDIGCEFVTITPGRALALPRSEGFRVLILDDASMALAAYTRYRDRVLENIIETDEGSFTSDNKIIEIPKIAKEILLDLFKNNLYSKYPAELLNKSEKLFYEKLSQTLSSVLFKDGGQGHSTNIFNYIANNSPNSQFILTYLNDKGLQNILCQNNREKLKKSQIDNLFLRQALYLNTYIKKYGINFISLSRGISKNYFDRFLENNCDNIYLTDDFKKYVNKSYYENFLNKISNETDAIIVQANVNSSVNINSNDLNYYSDCKVINNRIRVGYVNILSNSIPSLGSRDHDGEFVKDENKNTTKCTDLYINIAVEKRRPYSFAKGAVQFSTFNIGAEPPVGTQISSSFATPVAVVYLMYLKERNKILNNKDLLELIKVLKGENYIVLDPSLHKHLPIFELGYLK